MKSLKLEQLFGPTSPALEKEKAGIQTIRRRSMFQWLATTEAGLANVCLRWNKPDQRDCRNDHIQHKKRADPVGEQFTKEQRDV